MNRGYEMVLAEQEEARRRAVDRYFLTKDDELLDTKAELKAYKIILFVLCLIMGSSFLGQYLG